MKLSNGKEIFSLEDENKLYSPVRVKFDGIQKLSEKLDLQQNNAYVADDDEARNTAEVKRIEYEVFAELPVQSGWCYGGGKKMNGVEWHKSSEVVLACTDCVLILGDAADIIDDEYDSAKCVGLFLKKGEAVELKAGTLHLAPIAVDEFFAVAIILPKGTNGALKGGINGTLRAVNKWLLVHKENAKGIALGGKIGVIGENIEVK